MTWLPTVAVIIGMIWLAGTLIGTVFHLVNWHEERSQYFPVHDDVTVSARRALMAWAWPITVTRIAITTIRDLITDARH